MPIPKQLKLYYVSQTKGPPRAAHFKDKVLGMMAPPPPRGERSRASSVFSGAGGVRFATMQQRKSLMYQDRGVRDAMMKRTKKRVMALQHQHQHGTHKQHNFCRFLSMRKI